MHFAILQVLEPMLAAGEPFAATLDAAVDTFLYYWHPLNIEAICEPVPDDGWLPQQGYSQLRTKGPETIRRYADTLRFTDGELLATEFEFMVPIQGTWDALASDLGRRGPRQPIERVGSPGTELEFAL